MVHLTDPKRRPILFAVDHFVTTPLDRAAQLAIEAWTRDNNDSLAAALAPHGLTPHDIVVPKYERVVYRDEVEPIL